MKPKTFEDLIKKYPKIFRLMNEGYYRVSSDLPDQWVHIIDQMCSAIQSHIDCSTIHTKHGKFKPTQVLCEQIKEKYGGLRFYYHGGEYYSKDYEKYRSKWYRKWVIKLFNKYIGYPPDKSDIDGMVSMAEDMCWNTCFECGTNENLGTTQGWVTRLCKDCYEKSTYVKWDKDE
jgi:hypothetical protein